MKRAFLAIISLSLVFGGCSSPSSEPEQEEGVFLATIKYLRTHPPVKGYLPCFEERMLKRDATQSYILKTDDIYGLINNYYSSIMIRCSDARLTNKSKVIRYRLYQPSIVSGSATIKVDSSCGSLCGRGSTYSLHRENDHSVWHVTDVRQRWIS